MGLSESLPPGAWEVVFGRAKTGGIADGSGWAAGVVEISRSALTWTPEPSTARAGVRLLEVPITSVRGTRVSPHGGVQLDLLDGSSLVINVNRLNDAISVLRGLIDANEALG